MRSPARLVVPSLALAVLAAPSTSAAIEFKDLAGMPLTIDVTNTAIASYRFDNRNDPFTASTEPGVPARKPDPSLKVDDNYFDYTNRLNVQLGYWRFRLNVRLDSQVYAAIADSSNVIDRVIDETIGYGEEPDSNVIYDRSNEYMRELNTRYVPGIYPAKLSLVYQQPGVEITAGDFYAQLGRGLVFSVRKLDELAVDTTVRGGKVQLSKTWGAWRVGGTLLGGQMNPQRVDEQTGRVLIGPESPMFFGFPVARRLQTFDPATGQLVSEPVAKPNFVADTVVGGRVEGGHSFAQLSGNALVLLREENDLASTQNPAITAKQIRNFSGSVTLPALGKYADLYVEAAGQQIVDREDQTTDGYAVYVNANGRLGPLTVSLEGKHNRRFLALGAAVDTATVGYSAPQFSLLSYSAPPTAEPIYVEPIGVPNSCITGGRAQVQWRFNREASIYGWVGNYSSWTEFGDNNVSKCEEDSNVRTDTWDSAIGADLGFEEGKSYAKAWVGVRATDLATPTDGFVQVPGTTAVFYREAYVRYDLVKHLTGAFSLQSIGFHRHRYLPERHGLPWWEGENYLALQWAPRLSAAFGFEYTSRPGCARDAELGDFCFYASGGVVWRGAASDGIWGQVFNTVNLFVGQRRAAIRCVSGVCRLFPPFEGARLELVSRF